MIPINNSDTAWLIVSDYNQDNQLGYPDCLREDILNPEVNKWDWEFTYTGPGGGFSNVNEHLYYAAYVGDQRDGVGTTGSVGDGVGGGYYVGDYVGGHKT